MKHDKAIAAYNVRRVYRSELCQWNVAFDDLSENGLDNGGTN